MGHGDLQLYKYDDLRPAFFIDERTYDDPQLAQTVVESADAALTRAGVIYAVEVTSGAYAVRPVGVPTWEEFKQRHFVDGVPLPVRPAQPGATPPPSWPAMVSAVEAAHRDLRAELIDLVTTALPDHSVSVSRDHGPLRRSPGSVDWSEETFGFELTLGVALRGLAPTQALEAVSAQLTAHGWHLADLVPRPTGAALTAARDHYTVFVDAQRLRVVVMAKSPLFRAPAAPATGFLIEPR